MHTIFVIANVWDMALIVHVEPSEKGSSFRVNLVVKMELMTQIGLQLFLLTNITQASEVYHVCVWEM